MFTWRPDTGTIDETFSDQADAEEWLTLNFADLSAEGISTVTLLEDGEVVYGPMGLEPL